MTKSRKQRLFASVFLVLMILIGETIGLPFGDLTRSQEITAIILIIAAVLWITEWVSLFVVSFLILALEIIWLLPVLQVEELASKKDIFFSPFFSNIILLFLGGFVLSSLMQKYGLDIKFAQLILDRTKGKPAMTLLGIILVCSFLSMWISNTATTAMMLTMVFPLLKRIPDDQPFRKALVLAIPFACNLGGIGTPIGTPPNAIALSYLTKQGFNLSFLDWILFTSPFLVFFLVLLWQLLLRVFPAGDLTLEIDVRDSGKTTYKHVLAISIFGLTAIGWFTGSYTGLSTGTVALLPIIACFWLGLLDSSDFRSLPWDVLYMVAGGLALGVALNTSGLGAVLVGQLPLDASPLILLSIAAGVALVMSTVMSNTATAGLIIPLVMSLNFASEYMLSLVLALAMMCSMAMALPVSTPPNAIAFSSNAIKTKDMIMIGGLIGVVGFIVVALVGSAYWKFMIALLGIA